MDSDRAWWKEAVVYQVYPKSFNDTDGDGVGDLPGVVGKVDYLDELGVDVVWLNPVYESPGADNGYDVSDYRAIDPAYGTMDDLEELLGALHERDIRLVMDLVVNHTSDEHEWFRRAREGDERYRDYYIWREGEPGDPPNNWESHFGGPAWTYDEAAGAYYLHLFDEKQPDLNWRNPAVREEIYGMMEWWFERGIDGFRMDVINMISKPEGLPDGDPEGEPVGSEHFINGPHVMDYLREMHDRVLSRYDAMTVGEMPALSVEEALEYVAPDGPLDMAFQFEHMHLDFGPEGRWDVADWQLTDLKEVMTRWQEGLAAGGGWNSLYLGNHDQPRIVSRYGDDGEYRRESAKLFATMIFTLQGTPFVYQGEEIGMTNFPFERREQFRDVDTRQHVDILLDERDAEFEDIRDVVAHRSRDNSRTPMQWSDAENAGFTTGDPWIEVNPNHDEVNVERARADPGSVWHYYRRLIDLRADHPVLVHGDYELLLPDDEQVYAYRRTLDGTTALVELNVSGERAHPDLAGPAAGEGDLLLGNYEDAGGPGDPLRPYEARVHVTR